MTRSYVIDIVDEVVRVLNVDADVFSSVVAALRRSTVAPPGMLACLGQEVGLEKNEQRVESAAARHRRWLRVGVVYRRGGVPAFALHPSSSWQKSAQWSPSQLR